MKNIMKSSPVQAVYYTVVQVIFIASTSYLSNAQLSLNIYNYSSVKLRSARIGGLITDAGPYLLRLLLKCLKVRSYMRRYTWADSHYTAKEYFRLDRLMQQSIRFIYQALQCYHRIVNSPVVQKPSSLISTLI